MNQCTEQEVNRLLAMVSEQRREQALHYKHTFGQYCCLKAYLMLTELLAEWGRIHQLTIPTHPIFLYNEYGAPRIDNGPYISISHCKNGIAVAVNDTPIGIDIEAVRPLKGELMQKTMNPTEQAEIRKAEQADWQFIRLWTKKEAYLKMLGTGIISDLHHVLDNTDTIYWHEISHQEPDYICTIAKQ